MSKNVKLGMASVALMLPLVMSAKAAINNQEVSRQDIKAGQVAHQTKSTVKARAQSTVVAAVDEEYASGGGAEGAR